MGTTGTEQDTHADGAVLLAVAEGDAERQPDEATLAHIFSCARCGATLQELRQGLSGLAVGASVAPSAEEFLANDAGLDLASAESFAAEQRARSMIWKLAIVGVLLAIGMLWLRSSAASLG